MASIWTLEGGGNNLWAVHSLDAEYYFVSKKGQPLMDDQCYGEYCKALICRVNRQITERWALICKPQSGIRINGVPVLLGIRVLEDRDEIRFPGWDSQRVFFSTERLAEVQPFPGSEHPMYCPRCHQVMEAGTPSVQCPNPKCGVWYHESESKCWTYSKTCALCDQQTDLDAGYRWSPMEL